MKNNIEEYKFFIDSVAEEPDAEAAMSRFCSVNVDPVGAEAGKQTTKHSTEVGSHARTPQRLDHVQMHALCSALQINLHVAYLDGHKKDNVDIHKFESANAGFWKDPITLLYRYVQPQRALLYLLTSTCSPGHYDILVRGKD